LAFYAFENKARILQIYELPSLLIDDLSHTLLDSERFAAIRHHLGREAHSPVEEPLVNGLKNRIAVLYADKLAHF